MLFQHTCHYLEVYMSIIIYETELQVVKLLDNKVTELASILFPV